MDFVVREMLLVSSNMMLVLMLELGNIIMDDQGIKHKDA